jgi:hypothetical protein
LPVSGSGVSESPHPHVATAEHPATPWCALWPVSSFVKICLEWCRGGRNGGSHGLPAQRQGAGLELRGLQRRVHSCSDLRSTCLYSQRARRRQPPLPGRCAAALHCPLRSTRPLPPLLPDADGDVPLPTPLSPSRYNVKDFGAKGDGETDDTAALLVRRRHPPPAGPALATARTAPRHSTPGWLTRFAHWRRRLWPRQTWTLVLSCCRRGRTCCPAPWPSFPATSPCGARG